MADKVVALVVGAGPVGLTMAMELRRYGIDLRKSTSRRRAPINPNVTDCDVRGWHIASFRGDSKFRSLSERSGH